MPGLSELIFQPGTLFQGRYRIVRCIKEGGMGAVYEVVDEKTAGSRALKVMLPNLLENEGLRARFALEARITGGIESDHIVRTFDAGVDEATATPFIVMDLLRGEDLGGVLKRRKLLAQADVALYLYQAARALDKTHAAGIVHRDLKPDNLFLTFRDDGSPCIKILDFGIAKVTVAPDPSIKTRPMMGTPLYMSPEQVRNERTIGPGADVYALGHITYTMLVGEPYWAEEAENIPSPFLLISEIMRGAQDPASARARRRRSVTLPEAFDAWFFRMTALTAQGRYDRATDAIQGLGDALGVSLPKPPPPQIFDVGTTNPVGDELSLHGDGTTRELSPSSIGEMPIRRAIDTPTVATNQARSPVEGTGGATSSLDASVPRSRPDPQVTGIEGPTSAPASSMSSVHLTREAEQTLAAAADVGRSPSAREKTPQLTTRDRPSPPSAGRERSPASSPMDRMPPPTVPRERPVTPPIHRPASFSMAREQTPPIPPMRDKTLPARTSAVPARAPAPPAKSSTPTPVREVTSSRREPPANRRFTVTVDHKLRILRLKVWGFWAMDEVKAYVEEFEQKARTLVGRPWYVLADISDFPPQKGEVNERLAEPMKFARAHGMVRAANLVSSALPKMLIARMSAETGLPAFSFFSSEPEAITWLLQK